MQTLFATTARGFEELLKVELEKLGAFECRITSGGVHYEASDEVLYRTLLWSRLASRILLPIASAKIYSDQDLYSLIITQDWLSHFTQNESFLIDFNGTNDAIRHTQYGAMRIKDGIVDYFVNKGYERPNINKDTPDIRINAHLYRDEIVIGLDLSGEALHKRGYRTDGGQAPLRETLAAAIIMRSGWQQNTPLVDPMCGSGTLLIEAAQMAAQIAPQLTRYYWGFNLWLGHKQDIWQKVRQEALDLAEQALDKDIQCYGYDLDPKAIKIAKQNAKNAGVDSFIKWQIADVAELTNPCPEIIGTVICNPPYGERLATTPGLIALYTTFGQRLKQEFPNWNVSVFSSAPELLSCIRLRSHRQFKAKNGDLDCLQKNYLISDRPTADTNETKLPNSTTILAPDFANRLTKNIKKFTKLVQQQGIEAYRLYDADLPDYNFAIDCYADYVVIQEYAAPKNIEPEKARQRLLDAVSATLSVMQLPTNQLILKTRQQQKGTNQYEKLANKGDYFYINEYHAKFWVNLTDYLDTGLFLDHRLTRRMIGNMAKDKNFLNLFAYTGSATVYAALGGAKTTTTVDMSNTYLNWAEQNLMLNDIGGEQHKIVQQDCLQWLENCSQKFDLIFVDPPTFSNSKRMQDSWDVQRDHIMLFEMLKSILTPQGTIVFSNNKRGFNMNLAELNNLNLVAENITEQTIPFDFQRNKKIHNCWLVTHTINESD